MIDQIASMPALTGEQAMNRLADRLASLAPPPAFAAPRVLAASTLPLSPAGSAASAAGAPLATRAAERTHRPRSAIGMAVDSFVAACAFIPYALVALVLRLVMARVFFLDGQSRVEGLRIPLIWRDFDFSFVLPLQVKADAAAGYLAQVPPLPVPPALAAWTIAGAEFILPILLVLGLGARFAALSLLGLTALFQLLLPQALWSAHVYWASILLVLISLGAGPISLDAIVRFMSRR